MESVDWINENSWILMGYQFQRMMTIKLSPFILLVSILPRLERMRSGKLKAIMLYNENKINWKYVLFSGRAFFIGVGICAVT